MDCAVYVNSLFQVFDYLLENGETEYVQEQLNLCNPVDVESEADVSSFYETQLAFISEYIERFQ